MIHTVITSEATRTTRLKTDMLGAHCPSCGSDQYCCSCQIKIQYNWEQMWVPTFQGHSTLSQPFMPHTGNLYSFFAALRWEYIQGHEGTPGPLPWSVLRVCAMMIWNDWLLDYRHPLKRYARWSQAAHRGIRTGGDSLVKGFKKDHLWKSSTSNSHMQMMQGLCYVI